MFWYDYIINAFRSHRQIVECARTPFSRSRPDLLGCAFPVSENWPYGGRGPAILAKYPPETSASHVDMQCASSLATTAYAYLEIANGNEDMMISGGYEHMTRVPMGVDNPQSHLTPNCSQRSTRTTEWK